MADTNNDDFWSVPSGRSPEKVKVVQITKTPNDESTEENSGYKFEYPWWIRIEDANGNIVTEDKTSKSTFARDWNKKFYIRRDEDREQVMFTRHAITLALFTLLRAMNINETEYKEDIRKLEGFEFEAIVAGNETVRFIDWAATFLHNGVRVPTINELEDNSPTDSKKETKEKESDKIDPDNLPF